LGRGSNSIMDETIEYWTIKKAEFTEALTAEFAMDNINEDMIKVLKSEITLCDEYIEALS